MLDAKVSHENSTNLWELTNRCSKATSHKEFPFLELLPVFLTFSILRSSVTIISPDEAKHFICDGTSSSSCKDIPLFGHLDLRYFYNSNFVFLYNFNFLFSIFNNGRQEQSSFMLVTLLMKFPISKTGPRIISENVKTYKYVERERALKVGVLGR